MIEEMFENQSQYDPSRKTVGAIYRDAKLANSEDRIESGDMTRELIHGYVDDLNECIHQTTASGEWRNREFYVTVHIQKDLAMPNMLKFRLIKTLYRPYPEDDTDVYRINKDHTEVRFCWSLPHNSEMPNMLACPEFYEPQMVDDIKKWRGMNMEHFGFVKVGMGDQYAMNTYWTFEKDRKLEKPRRVIDPSANQLLL